jgi:PAS domain S-box-containing protein
MVSEKPGVYDVVRRPVGPGVEGVMSEVHPEQGEQPVEQREAAPGLTSDAPALRSMLSMEEVLRRPSRPPDHATESQALLALAREMATSPKGILQKLADTALSLCRAHSAGLSLLEDGDQRRNFHWRAIAGQWAPHLNGGTPRNFGPCGTVLDQDVAMVCSHPELDFPYWAPIKPVLEEGLLIPFYIKGEAVGTIWIVAHDTSRRFDAEDLRVMTSLGTFAAAAYQAWLSVNESHWLASIVESSSDAIISKDLNGVITTWNKGAERIFGYTAEEAVGKPVTMLIPPDRVHEETTILEPIRRGERVEHYETVRQRKYGGLIDISLTISPVTNAEGRIVGASKIARDITERKRSDKQIAILAREAEHRAKNILATVQATVHLTQSDTPAGLKQAIEGRIKALANAHKLFVESRWTEPPFVACSRTSLPPTARTEMGARALTVPTWCCGLIWLRQLRLPCTSLRPTRPSTGHYQFPMGEFTWNGCARLMDGSSLTGARGAARLSSPQRVEASARG